MDRYTLWFESLVLFFCSEQACGDSKLSFKNKKPQAEPQMTGDDRVENTKALVLVIGSNSSAVGLSTGRCHS